MGMSKNQTAIGGIKRETKDRLRRFAMSSNPAVNLGSLADFILSAWLDEHEKGEPENEKRN